MPGRRGGEFGDGSLIDTIHRGVALSRGQIKRRGKRAIMSSWFWRTDDTGEQ